MESKSGYWIYQFAWWGFYAAIGLTINALNGAKPPSLIVSHIIFIAYSIGLTHLFRLAIERRRGLHPSSWRFRGFLMKPIAPARLAAALAKVRPRSAPFDWSAFSCVTAITAGSSRYPISFY